MQFVVQLAAVIILCWEELYIVWFTPYTIFAILGSLIGADTITFLIPNLKLKHSVSPVHTLTEIKLLKKNFNNQIRQFNVYDQEKLIAGATIFESKKTAHVQYISSDSSKNTSGSLDFLFSHLIGDIFKSKEFFDFGNSNENNGESINKGLIYWKEGFGAKSITQDFYKIETNNYTNLDNLFI